MSHPLSTQKAVVRELGPGVSRRFLPRKQNCSPPESTGSTPQRRKPQLLLLTGIILGSLLSYFLISKFVVMSVEITGVSMSPTLLNGDRYLLYRYPYLWRSPHNGEIVVIKDPADNDLSIKRIVGGPRDTVEIRRDGVYVNKHKLTEPYLTSFAARACCDNPIEPVRLGADDYFVLGDNRGRSADSRSYGPVHRNAILGLIAKSE